MSVFFLVFLLYHVFYKKDKDIILIYTPNAKADVITSASIVDNNSAQNSP